MAMQAPITGAFHCAPNLRAIMTQIEAADTASTAPLNLSRYDRAWLGDLVETLIAVLDCADGDADREHDDLDRCLAADDGPVRDPQLDALWSAAA